MKFPENMPDLDVYKAVYPGKYKTLFAAYVRWVKLLSYRGFKLKKTSDHGFNLLYRAVSRTWNEKQLLGFLQQSFIKENLSLSLLLEPLDGFEWISKNRYPLELSSSSPIMLQIITPFARLIAALNHQHPPFYQPFANLICAYLWLYLPLMPEQMAHLKRMGISLNVDKMRKDLPLLHKESLQVLPVIDGFIFKAKIAFYLGLCKVLIKQQSQNQQIKWKKNFYVNAFLYGLWYMITIKGKSIQLNRV